MTDSGPSQCVTLLCRQHGADTDIRTVACSLAFSAMQELSSNLLCGCPVHAPLPAHARLCLLMQVVARSKEDILAAKGVKPTLSPNLNVLATVEALDVKRLLFIGVGCQVCRALALPLCRALVPGCIKHRSTLCAGPQNPEGKKKGVLLNRLDRLADSCPPGCTLPCIRLLALSGALTRPLASLGSSAAREAGGGGAGAGAASGGAPPEPGQAGRSSAVRQAVWVVLRGAGQVQAL